MKKTLSFIFAALMIISSVVLAIPAGAASLFDDIAETRWSYESVKYAVGHGYMNGVADRKFSPTGFLTRAMVATVLWRRQGEPRPAALSGFSDVPEGKWYTDAVAWAKEQGVVQGVSDTNFKPDDNVTREQLATMLFRFSETCPVSVPERADLGKFPDGKSVHGWAAEAMGWAVEAALVKGASDGSLDPSGFATREQFAAIIERFDNTFTLKYNPPVIRSHYTEKPYPLVEDADLYVSPDGDDSADGSFDHPLATFEGAVAKVRDLKAKKSGNITVAFKAGTYGPVNFELGPDDSGSQNQRITYCKYGDGDVIFDNGLTVKAESFEPITEDERALFPSKAADKIKKVDIGSLIDEIPDFDNFALFSDTELCTVARFPNKYSDGSDHFIQAAQTYDERNFEIFNPVLQRKLATYGERIVEVRLYGYLLRGYRKDTYTLCSYDEENHLLRTGVTEVSEFGGKLREGWRDADGQGVRLVVINAPGELDYTGEYWVDRQTDTLYVYDPSGDYHIPLPHGEKRLRGVVNYDTGDGYKAAPGYCAIYAEDVGYITLRGLRFTNNVDEFIIAYKTSGFEIDRCRFDCCTGKNQVLFEHSLPDEDLGLHVTDSEFDLCVGRHVFVFDEANGPERFTNRSEIYVDNCLFAHSNLSFDAEGALNLHCCSGGLVTHNRFENCCRYAVMFTGSCDVIVEYNDFDSAMTNSDDGGVTRGCGDVLGNNIVRYNFYNSVLGGSVGRMAHYCDNGDCGTIMYSNLIYHGTVVYHGSGRDNELSLNVLIGAGASVGSFTGDIIEYGEAVASANNWMIGNIKNQWVTVRNYIENVPGYSEALELRRPGATSMIYDFSQAADKRFILAPTNTFIGNLFVNEDASFSIGLYGNSADYCTVEDNRMFTYAENPVFVNPTIGDYRIREGADFPDYHFEQMGRY